MTFYEGGVAKGFVHRHTLSRTPDQNQGDEQKAGSFTLDVCDRHHKKDCGFERKDIDTRPENEHRYCYPVCATLSEGCVCCKQEDEWASLYQQVQWMRAMAKGIKLQSESAPGSVNGWAHKGAQVAANMLVDLADGLDDRYADLLLEEGGSKEGFGKRTEEKTNG